VLSTPPSPNLNLPLSRCASPLPTLSRTPSLLWSPSPSNPEFGTSLEKQPELTRTAALRAANKVKAVRDAQRSSDETVQLRSRLATAHAEIDILHADSFRLEATIAELRGRLAAAENMLDTYEDLAREVEDERRQLEGDKFMLELENARLEKKNAMLMARDTKGRR
jgi:chromosome segregation ATPase